MRFHYRKKTRTEHYYFNARLIWMKSTSEWVLQWVHHDTEASRVNNCSNIISIATTSTSKQKQQKKPPNTSQPTKASIDKITQTVPTYPPNGRRQQQQWLIFNWKVSVLLLMTGGGGVPDIQITSDRFDIIYLKIDSMTVSRDMHSQINLTNNKWISSSSTASSFAGAGRDILLLNGK